MGRLDGEIALVTGSTSGIGAAIVARLAGEGAAVMVTGRDAARGAAAVERITDEGGVASFVAADLTDPSAAGAIVEAAVRAFGGLSVLVNNAVGGSGDAGVAEVTDDAWTAVLDIDLGSALRCCRAALPHLRASSHSAIVNVSSRAARRGTPGFAAYSAAKAGLDALTRSVAVEEAGHGVRCNTISVGYVLNDRRDADLAAERRRRLEAMHLTRLGRADDVAWAAVYLASAEAGFVTGITLPVDGGSTIARAATLG